MSETSVAGGQLTEPAGECFVIMPFGGYFDEYYKRLYAPAIEGAGLKPRRADDLFRPSAIVHDIWEFTQAAQVILADLTGRNPNVFYELGLAHAITKPAVLLAETMDDVPFDLRGLRIITFNKNEPDWGLRLQSRITSSVLETLEKPLKSIPPSFLKTTTDSKPTEVSATELAVLELRQDVERLSAAIARLSLPSALMFGSAGYGSSEESLALLSKALASEYGKGGFFKSSDKPDNTINPSA
jgi:hypothetical protein